MRNSEFDRRLREARHYHQTHREGRFLNGILARYDYSEIDPQDLSWCGDVQFILGGVRVSVAWRHPRFVYQGLIDKAALDATDQLYQQIEGGLFRDDEKQYVKRGRSRKQVFSYRTVLGEQERAWLAAVQAEKDRLRAVAEFSVVPTFQVETLNWCRYVTLVAPLEVRSLEELGALAMLSRRLVKRETTLAQVFPGYVYDRTNWVAEGLADHSSGPVTHRLAGI